MFPPTFFGALGWGCFGERGRPPRKELRFLFSKPLFLSYSSPFWSVILSVLSKGFMDGRNFPLPEGDESYKGLGVEIGLILLEGEASAHGSSVWFLLVP